MPGTERPPTVYVIAGPNGAGKTTFAEKFLPDFVKCREFLNADLIAAGLSPFSPGGQDLRAGRLMLERMEELTKAREDFGFETTLSGKGVVNRLHRLKAFGYRTVVFFLWLPDSGLAKGRVAKRVRQGGHFVPDQVVERRFTAGLQNFVGPVRSISDIWWLFDASAFPPRVVSIEEYGNLIILDRFLHNQIRIGENNP